MIIALSINSILTLACLYFLWQLKTQQKQQISQQLEQALQDQFIKTQQFFSQEFKQSREESQQQQLRFQESVFKQLNTVLQNNGKQGHQLRESVEKRLALLQQDNNQKLEKMRETVDEKLHKTLEKRLGESFKQVSERLEHVHKGLGEMKELANGVGDLKKVLVNVKTRGTWGEVQCSQLLEQVLAPQQYESQVRVRARSNDVVDFAIKLPGKEGDQSRPVWLPIDAKCPLENYQQLVQAQEAGDKEGVQTQVKQLQSRIRLEAKSIQTKYIHPPETTDFAIMYLPTEGLYAEVLRLAGLQEELQSKYRVLIAGPTTLAALLNSLQMGFKTMAIEKRSSEVWSILSGVKQEFNTFGTLLEKTHKKLQEAGNTIEKATTKTRTIERKLRSVETLPETTPSPPLFEANLL